MARKTTMAVFLLAGVGLCGIGIFNSIVPLDVLTSPYIYGGLLALFIAWLFRSGSSAPGLVYEALIGQRNARLEKERQEALEKEEAWLRKVADENRHRKDLRQKDGDKPQTEDRLRQEVQERDEVPSEKKEKNVDPNRQVQYIFGFMMLFFALVSFIGFRSCNTNALNRRTNLPVAKPHSAMVPAVKQDGKIQERLMQETARYFEKQAFANEDVPLGQTEERTFEYESLKIGSTYRISEVTALMPDCEPVGVDATILAMAQKITLPVSSTILIHEKRDVQGTIWYRVDANGLRGEYLGMGWVNSTAFYGQTIRIVHQYPQQTKTNQRRQATVSRQNWFDNGFLVRATLGEWKSASYDDKLATAGCWLANTLWKDRLNSLQDFESLRFYASRLVSGIDYTTNGIDTFDASWKANEMAALLITVAPEEYCPWLGPS